MSLAAAIAAALVEAAAALERNQADIDAMVARNAETDEANAALTRLDRERASLTRARDSLLIADAEVADSPSAH